MEYMEKIVKTQYMKALEEKPKYCPFCGCLIEARGGKFCSKSCRSTAGWISSRSEGARRWLLEHSSDYSVRDEYLRRLRYYKEIHGGD